MLKNDTYPGLIYCQFTGQFWRLHFQDGKLVQDRQLLPDEDCNLSYFCAVLRKPVKKKAARIAWEIVHNISSTGLHILHLDLDEYNLRASNLKGVNKEEYKRFKDCLLNVQGAVKMKPVPTDAFSYIVQYRRDGKLHQKRCHDVVSALKFKRRVLFHSTKVLGKYVSTE